jgi:hypothetical protein
MELDFLLDRGELDVLSVLVGYYFGRDMTLPTHTENLRIHSVRALHPGPRLIVLGAVHGNTRSRI